MGPPGRIPSGLGIDEDTGVVIERGRLVVKGPPADWIRKALLSVPMRECPLTHEVALESRRIRVEHEDPADRFLAASAIVWNLTLLTADSRLLGSSGLRTLKAD